MCFKRLCVNHMSVQRYFTAGDSSIIKSSFRKQGDEYGRKVVEQAVCISVLCEYSE